MESNKKEVSRKVRITRIIFLALYVLTAGFLIVQSLLPGDISAKESNGVGPIVTDVINGIAGDQSKIVEPESVELQASRYEFNMVQSRGYLVAKTYPDNATYCGYTYTSSDPSVIEVDQYGNLKCLSFGTCEIECVSTYNSNIRDKKTFVVEDKSTTILKIGIKDAERRYDVYQLEQYHSYSIVLQFTSGIPYDRSYTYTLMGNASEYVSICDDILKINEISDEIFTLRVTYHNRYEELRFKCINNYPTTNIIDNIDIELKDSSKKVLDNNDVTLYLNDAIDINILNDIHTYKYDFTYQIENENIATIYNNQITPKALGDTSILISERFSGLSKRIDIKVRNRIEIHGTTVGGHHSYDYYRRLHATRGQFISIVPWTGGGTTYQKCTYVLDNDNVVISPDGGIAPMKCGQTKVTMIIDDGYQHEEGYVVLYVDPLLYTDTIPNFPYIVRKVIGHFGMFLILGIFSTFTYFFYLNKKHKVLDPVINFSSGLLIAFITELLQMITIDRYGAFQDVMIDYAGFVISSIIITVALLIIRIILKKKKAKQPDDDYPTSSN